MALGDLDQVTRSFRVYGAERYADLRYADETATDLALWDEASHAVLGQEDAGRRLRFSRGVSRSAN